MKRLLFLNYKSSNDNSSNFMASFSIEENITNYHLNFAITSTTETSWNISHNWHYQPWKNWSLWEKDVVEIFWQPRKHKDDFEAPYFEWQLSPNNYAFCLNIISPRQNYFTPLECPLKYKNHVAINQKTKHLEWHCTFIVPKNITDSTQNPFIAIGAFAILGKNGNRCFYSLVNEKVQKADFHIPHNFFLLSELT